MRTYEVNYKNEDQEVVLTQHIQAKNQKQANKLAQEQAPEDCYSFSAEKTDF